MPNSCLLLAVTHNLLLRIRRYTCPFRVRIPLKKADNLRKTLLEKGSWEHFLKHRQEALNNRLAMIASNDAFGNENLGTEIDELLKNYMVCYCKRLFSAFPKGRDLRR